MKNNSLILDLYKKKVCRKCGQELYLDRFGNSKRYKDGKYPYCKKCRNSYKKTDAGRKRKQEVKKKNKNWLNKTQYEYHYKKLEDIEDIRRDPDNYKLLQVRCTYCNKWMNPSIAQVKRRDRFIEGKDHKENRFYCSSGCKKSCPIFGVSKYPKGLAPATPNEVQPELRKLVLERDGWRCQKCGSTKELHCHHADPTINNYIESADMDNCFTLCKKCHIEIHKESWCKILVDRCKGKTTRHILKPKRFCPNCSIEVTKYNYSGRPNYSGWCRDCATNDYKNKQSNIKTKTCSKCKQEKLKSEFNKYSSMCKLCEREKDRLRFITPCLVCGKIKPKGHNINYKQTCVDCIQKLEKSKTSKVCNVCKREKPIEKFINDKNKRYKAFGFDYTCNDCLSKNICKICGKSGIHKKKNNMCYKCEWVLLRGKISLL